MAAKLACRQEVAAKEDAHARIIGLRRASAHALCALVCRKHENQRVRKRAREGKREREQEREREAERKRARERKRERELGQDPQLGHGPRMRNEIERLRFHLQLCAHVCKLLSLWVRCCRRHFHHVWERKQTRQWGVPHISTVSGAMSRANGSRWRSRDRSFSVFSPIIVAYFDLSLSLGLVHGRVESWEFFSHIPLLRSFV